MPVPSREGITVPRPEWGARLDDRRTAGRTTAIPETVPIWWEGPPTAKPALPSRAPGLTSASRNGRPARASPSASVPAPPPNPMRAVARPTARYSFKELSDELTELEALVYANSGLQFSRTVRSPPAARPSTSACMDCERPLTAAASATPCRGCGRGLCARCVASSKSEDGEVVCVECRARAP